MNIHHLELFLLYAEWPDSLWKCEINEINEICIFLFVVSFICFARDLHAPAIFGSFRNRVTGVRSSWIVSGELRSSDSES